MVRSFQKVLRADSGFNPVRIPNAPANTGDAISDTLAVDLFPARAEYVEAMGMRLIAGRSFAEFRPSGVFEALVDRGVSDRFFPGGTALGATIPLFGRTVTAVGGSSTYACMTCTAMGVPRSTSAPRISMRAPCSGP